MANNSRKALSNFLSAAIANGKTTKMALHKEAKIGRPSIDAYLDRESAPTLDQLDRLASALGIQTWELIKPDGATPSPEPKVIILANLTEDQLTAAAAAISGAIGRRLPQLDK